MKTLREIGKTGMSVPAIGYGGMPISIQGRPDRAVSKKVIAAAFEAGTRFFDTADVYCLDDNDIGHNEILITEGLKEIGALEKSVIATKGGLKRPNGDWTVDCSPKHLREACEKSLKALGIDQIFLYQLHTADPKVSYEDSVGELKLLQDEGKIKHIGISNVTAEQTKIAMKVARIESIQNRCHPFLALDYTNGVVDLCEKHQMTFFPHSPVGGHTQHVRVAENKILKEIGARHSATSYEIMLAWHLGKSETVIPIPGASRAESAKSSPRALKIELSKEEMKAVDSLGNS